MHLSRSLAAAAAACVLAATMPQLAQAREIVGFSGSYSSGTVVVKTSERALYYVLGNGKAVRYPVGVGRIGKQWSGTAYISSKQLRPAWSPPAEVKRDKPSLPNVIPGGSPGNPMGAAALTLSGGGEYAIHGTNNPGSIASDYSIGIASWTWAASPIPPPQIISRRQWDGAITLHVQGMNVFSSRWA